MNGDREQLFEMALLAEGPPDERQELNRLLAADPGARADWIAHRRLAVRLHALAPNPDLGARVLAVALAGRQSRRLQVADGVRRRLARRRRGRAWAAATVLAAVAALMVAMVMWPRPIAEVQRADGGRESILAGTALATEAALVVRWPDGSVATLAAGTRATVLADGLQLVDGAVDCQIAPRAAAPFRIATAQAEVVVLGTRFRCTAAAGGCGVTVAAGSVRFTAAGSALQLGAGESARAVAGSAPRREQVLFRWQGATGQLTLGTIAADGSIHSGVYTDERLTCPAIRLDAASGSALFHWRPGLTMRVAVRVAEPGLKVQCYAAAMRANHAAEGVVPVGVWTVASYRLDDLRPYSDGARLTADAAISHLVVVPTDEHADPFAIGWIEVTAEVDAEP